MELSPSRFFQRHPIVRDALLWAIPAIALGALLRILFLSYSPYAYWGSDSNSYFGFAERLLSAGKISLYDKRRYVYPLLLFPISALPGATLKWLVWFQHTLGLATLVPLAYCVRKSFAHWRWFIVPVTVIYTGIPIILWYEHELLAENVFFAAVIWSCAGWIAWVSQENPARKRQLWWWFLASFAVLILTKPSGRFFIPGIVLALVAVRAWRFLRWREAGAFAAACALTLTIGQDSQGAWLLYTSSFPLTRIDTPLHAEYKAEVKDLVTEARQRLSEYKADDDRKWKAFLKNPEEQSERPLWQALGKNTKLKMRVYKDLAVEGILHRPDLFLLVAFEKILSSANPDDFKAERFLTDYSPRKFEHLYEKYQAESPRRLRMLFGLSKNEPLPPFSQVEQWLAPKPDSAVAKWIFNYTEWFEGWMHLIEDETVHEGKAEVSLARALRPMGWWILAGVFLSFLPFYFRRLGLWTMIIGGYLFGVFLVGGANARFFGAAWPILTLLLPVPIDALSRGVADIWKCARAQGINTQSSSNRLNEKALSDTAAHN
ncbi:hypothetical protein ACXR0O_21185 [Verrucomicrobiota bacterium sgz303538]